MRLESPQPALTESQRAIVCEVLDRVIPGAEVWLFGSRTTGRARPFSDLDLLITRPGRLTWAQRAALSDGFEASELPFRVDLVEADGLAAEMATRIMAERMALR